MSEKPKGLFGRNISTKMRKDLCWQAVYLYDLFDGLWHQPKGIRGDVFISNSRLADEFGWSVGTVKRALQQLEEQGYIRRIVTNGFNREILPGGSIFSEGGGGSGEIQGGSQVIQGGDQERSRGGITGDPNKTLQSKTLQSERGTQPPPVFKRMVYDEEYFKAQGKTPAKEFPELFFSDIEKDSIRAYYAGEDLDLEEGLTLLQHCAYNNRERFLGYASHYHAMVGWVAQEMRKQARNKLYLTKAKEIRKR